MQQSKPYSISDAKKLINLARRAIENTFLNKETSDDKLKKEYSLKQGVFVTLNLHDELRGCIGFVLPYYSLYDGILTCAKAAAFEDNRFEPLREKELKETHIEISILTVPEEIKNNKEELPEKIKIGRDGLMVKNGYYSGLLLPQVFVEYKVNSEKALEMTCQKAGLPSNAWKKTETKIEKFSAQVFKELKPKGKIVEEKF